MSLATSAPRIIKEGDSKKWFKFIYPIDSGNLDERTNILGIYSLTEKTISIDQTLEICSEEWNFTFAHEFGHFVLHREIKNQNFVIKPETSNNFEKLETDKMNSKSPLEWLVWQANAFASSLLMPNFAVKKVLEDYQKEYIGNNKGMIYVDFNNRSSQKEFQNVL